MVLEEKDLEQRISKKLKEAEYFARLGESDETTKLLREIKEYYIIIDPELKTCHTIIDINLLNKLKSIRDQSYKKAIHNRAGDILYYLYKKNYKEARINFNDALALSLELLLMPKKYRGGL